MLVLQAKKAEGTSGGEKMIGKNYKNEKDVEKNQFF